MVRRIRQITKLGMRCNENVLMPQHEGRPCSWTDGTGKGSVTGELGERGRAFVTCLPAGVPASPPQADQREGPSGICVGRIRGVLPHSGVRFTCYRHRHPGTTGFPCRRPRGEKRTVRTPTGQIASKGRSPDETAKSEERQACAVRQKSQMMPYSGVIIRCSPSEG